MTVYIQSRGIPQDKDYQWLKVESEELVPEIPEALRSSFETTNGETITLTNLIDSQKQSLVLARNKRGKLFLLITGLKAKEERIDFMERSIRNSIVWICDENSESEKLLRGLTIQALRDIGKFEHDIDEAISNDDKYGFKVSQQNIKNIEEDAQELIQASNQTANYEGLIGNKNSLELLSELSMELESNCLPDNYSLLIVVTTFKSKDALEKARIWRSLSSRVDGNQWSPIPQATGTADPSNWMSNLKKDLLGRIPPLIAAILLVIVVLILVKIMLLN
ncbi:hypothetical protein [Calothrix sp. CCY 0018]|uniref:hypothetical protein n=1 Tax=Calothrix sp. CCY 0018 TaxID=3103864 RepID=UPI0039C68F54